MADLLPTSEVPSRVALESTVRANEGAAREWVLALLQLHDRRLYRETHSSWDAYVLETFGYSHSTATRWLAQGREILALEAAPEDKAAGQDRPRAAALPSQRQAAKAQKARNAPIPVPSTEAPSNVSTGVEREPSPTPPVGQSSRGSELQPPAGPTDEAAPKRPSSRSAPLDPPSVGEENGVGEGVVGASPTDPFRELVDDLQSCSTVDLRAYNGPWRVVLETEVRRAAEALGVVRRSGTVTPPPARGLATTDPRTCAHPKDKRKHLGYIVKCEACGVKIA